MNQPVKQLSTCLLVALALALLATGRAGAASSDRQSLQMVQQAVIEFVRAQHAADADLEVSPDPLDRRLKLAPCEQAVEAFWAPGSSELGQTTVGVRCDGARPWKLYLPTRVRLMQPVVVARRPLARGQHIGADDLALEKHDLGALRGTAIQDPAQVLGYLVTRPVPAGRVLEASLLDAPILVERGRTVRMAVVGAGINITMAGTALEDGALGEMVRVRNPASRRVVEGVVSGPGRVRLEIPGAMQITSRSQ